MKNLFKLLLASTLFVACNNTKKSDGEAHAAMIESTIKIETQSDKSSIYELKRLNYELLEEIGFDDSQISVTISLLRLNVTVANYLSKKGVLPNKEILDNKFKTSFLELFSEEDYTKFKTIQDKLKL